MKYINEILTAVSVITLLGAVSCNKEKAVETAGSAIRFGVSTSYENTPETKTTYTGENPDGTPITSSSTIERIDWESTDKIRIGCYHDTPVSSSDDQFELADYQIVLSDNGTDQTHAGLSPVDGNGLQWGEGVHDFIALYPSPAQLSGDHAASTALYQDGVAGIIPAIQTATLDGHVFKPDMNYAYMYAIASGVEKGSDVQLDFHPLVTTLEFTLLTKEDDPITSKLTSVKLSSTQSNAYLTGIFCADIDKVNGFQSLDPENETNVGGNEITITLPDGGVQLNTTEAYTVTFLTLPMDQTELTLTLYFGDGTSKRTLDLKHDGIWITVPACNKTYIWNLAVPDQVGSVGEFSVSDSKKVGFARANLKYTGNGDGTGTWSIMDNPWDLVEPSNTYVAINYGHSATSMEIISLFGWGTSGNGDGTRSDPWRTDGSSSSTYGPNGKYNLTGDNFKYDWASNTISGLSGSNWHTPSIGEWKYILKQRSSLVDHAYTLATVAETLGLVIFPDGFDFSSSPFSSYEAASFKSSNNIAASEWTALEAKGCVFLPAAGYRNGTESVRWVYGQNLVGDYWSSTANDDTYSCVLIFDKDADDIEITTSYGWSRRRGHSVRLVRELE